MKISIVTICFNSETTIEATINSVLTQAIEGLEYIVIDGKSTDQTMSIVSKFDDFISHKISEPDLGIYDAMNKGIRLASGDVIGILNSDDLYAETTILADVLRVFEKTKADLVYGDIEFFDSESSKVTRKWRAGEVRRFSTGWHPPHPGLFVKRSVYQDFGSFNSVYKLAGDFEFMLRVIEKQNLNIAYLPKTLVQMRLGGESTNSNSARLRGFKEIKRAFRENGLTFPVLYPLYRYLPKLMQILKN